MMATLSVPTFKGPYVADLLVALFASRPVALRQGVKTTADLVQYAEEQQGRVG
jgi:hypothetical protein